MMGDLVDSLNSRQKEAVLHTQGPLMIVAGAGTGKTRTLTSRIAYLIDEKNVGPGSILAVTFTNRAASEMRERVSRLIKGAEAILPEIGTFHSIFAKILREEIHHLGYRPDFVILTEEERLCLLKEAGAISTAEAGKSLESISAFKNLRNIGEGPPPLFSKYQTFLKQKNSLDFDDLILLPLRLFEENPLALNKYRERFQYILVDEYQDLNLPQYRLVRLLSEPSRNLCVVRDADQAIYSFRGAHVENFLNFRKDYPKARIIRLERNYRSTALILKASEEVVCKNTKRMEKNLWTEEGTGNQIRIFEVEDEKQEGEWIVSRIEKLLGGTSMFQHDSDRVGAGAEAGSYSLSDMAVLFRLRTQAKPLQKIFDESGIPCRTLSGERIVQRPGTRRILSFLYYLTDPQDDSTLLKLIREQIKGIGPKALELIREYAEKRRMPVAATLTNGLRPQGLGEKEFRSIQDLLEKMNSLDQTRDRKSVVDLIRELSGFFDLDKGTLQNLITLSSRYRDRPWGTTLTPFLHDLTLSREVDLYDPRAEAVTLMTMHAAKGLEFPVVFIAGVEKELIPFTRHPKPPIDEIEEERRLFHVAMTRAMKELYLLHTRKRTLYGKTLAGKPSPFLKNIRQSLYRFDALQKPNRRTPKENPQLGLF